MDSAKKRIAIVGAGLAGTMSIIQVKDENMEPICFEKSSQPGGTWLYREESIVGSASIMPTTVINHSKEMGAISNFPPKKEYSNYMRHDQVYEYFKEYWKKYNCLEYVRFNTEVLSVKRNIDYKETGRWRVTVKHLLDGSVSEDIYDGVMVCNGFLNYPIMPVFPGQGTFQGRITHTHNVKYADEFKGQNVVIVGMGCSAMDAATEISSFAKKVYLSTRSGAYILSRVGPYGYPIDTVLLRRFTANFLNISTNLCSFFIEKFILDPVFDHTLFAVKPKYHVFSKQPNVCDLLPSKLLSGAVVQVKNIDHFAEDGVVFEGDDHVTKADVVIMATGYKWKFPFLEDGIVVQKDGKFDLYDLVFPPHLKHPTISIMNFALTQGAGFPIAEMQCRWVASVFAGRVKLPSENEMMKSITKQYLKNVKRYPPSDTIYLNVDYIPYLDKIASKIGVKPNYFKMFFTDNRLFWKLYFGPSVPYQYRLYGQHKWDGARDAILETERRIRAPLTRDE